VSNTELTLKLPLRYKKVWLAPPIIIMAWHMALFRSRIRQIADRDDCAEDQRI